MMSDIQKASLWKRFAAALLDIILVVVLVTGLFSVLGGIFGTDAKSAECAKIMTYYEEKYDIKLNISQEEIDAMPEAEAQAYQERVKATDEEFKKNPEHVKIMMEYMLNILLVVSVGILIAQLLLEFVVPLLMKNGQTVGKKVFSLCLVRQDSVKISTVQLLVRTLIGKIAVETMIPVCIIFMLLFVGYSNLFLLILLAGLLLAQIIIIIATKHNCLLHDLMGGTVVVDHSCQMIFDTVEDMEAYRKKESEERKARLKTY